LTLAVVLFAFALPARADDPLSVLQGMYAGARTHSLEGRVVYVYGDEMTAGATAEQAAQGFIASHGRIFGIGDLELVEQYRTEARTGNFTVFAYNPCESAHHGTLIEVLQVVDSQKQQEIVCAAFSAHSIVCAACCP
jgi:hypothetical protein